MNKPSATPKPTPKPVPKPHARATPAPHKKASTPKPPPKQKPRSAPRSTPEEKPSEPDNPPVQEKPPVEEATEDYIIIPSEAKSTPTPEQKAPVIQPQSPKGKTPAGRALDAPILIEKSGLQEEEVIEPTSRSIFGGLIKRWHYLSPSVRKAIDIAKVQRGRWKYIVVHNSGTRQGNARIFDLYHRNVRKMQNGLAYHFVIGNGNSSGNGEIEIGNRWVTQINGGHVASDYLNNIALGICLVGDLNRDLPTKEQLGALDELCSYLRGRVGKIKGRAAIVKGHKEINPKPTDCPGDRFPLGWLHKRFGN